jgi:hypothetical protein
MTRTTEPRIELVGLFDDGNRWDTSNTSFDFVPHIHEGEYNRNKPSEPQVAIEDDGPEPVDGGQTGLAGIPQSQNGKATQHMRGEPTIHCYSDRNDKAAEQVGGHEPAKKIADEISEEVKRIVRNNMQNYGMFHLLTWHGKSRNIETGVSETLVEFACNIRYWYFI